MYGSKEECRLGGVEGVKGGVEIIKCVDGLGSVKLYNEKEKNVINFLLFTNGSILENLYKKVENKRI